MVQMEIDKISSLWDSFFFPILNTLLIILALYIILGKDEFSRIWISLGKRIDRIIYSKPKTKEKDQTDQPRFFGALKKSIQEALKKPATWIFVCFFYHLRLINS